MPGNASGLIRVGQNALVLLDNIGPNSVAGPIGVGYSSGAQFLEAIGFKSYTFQVIQIGATAATGYTLTFYGTLDPIVHGGINSAGVAGDNSPQHNIFPVQRGSNIVPATSWFPLDAPAAQSGTGLVANPIVFPTSQLLISQTPVAAVMVVLTASATPTGSLRVVGLAVP